ncbi:Unknown protein, partial [Striga hermonthica]
CAIRPEYRTQLVDPCSRAFLQLCLQPIQYNSISYLDLTVSLRMGHGGKVLPDFHTFTPCSNPLPIKLSAVIGNQHFGYTKTTANVVVYEFNYFLFSCNLRGYHQSIVMRQDHPLGILRFKTYHWHAGRNPHLLSLPLHRSSVLLPGPIRVTIGWPTEDHVNSSSLHRGLSSMFSLIIISPWLLSSTASTISILISIAPFLRVFPTSSPSFPLHPIMIYKFFQVTCSNQPIDLILQMSAILRGVAIIFVKAAVNIRPGSNWACKPRLWP